MKNPLALLMNLFALSSQAFHTEKQEKKEGTGVWRENRESRRSYAGGHGRFKREVLSALMKPLPQTREVRNARKRFRQGRCKWEVVMKAAGKATS